ncbi:flagellar FliL protein [Modestobacter sp. DSM 44400]|uniref:flagellar basal body-associated FliL family protein n=1 Tax=Modestobacter sp. DSM 44400 TaxID=1550230 RepID=UPI0008974EC3|nr:flagellar basal body-associated FliL family protein [Modestobacter sp. DSM 44400]SDX87591.1 flagellar FliL protein [Modestobacter sp. DSM 44400]
MNRKTKDKDAATDEEGTKGGKKKLLVIALAAVLVIGAGAYFLVFSGGSAEAAEPEPGAVLEIDPVAINLAGGSYLKLGIALQFTADASAGDGSEPNGAKALDLAIAQFSGAALGDVQTNREAMKAALQESIAHAYHDTVMSIYYTEYVTQ